MEEAQLAAHRAKLSDPDPQVRIAAMEQFSDTAFKDNDDQRNVLPLLASLLVDPEVRVRRRAAECSLAVAYPNTAKYPRREPPKTDLASCPAWQSALRAALHDQDGRVQDAALSAYALAFPVAADVQDELAESYECEKKVEMLKTKIPYSLLIDNTPTPKAVALLERLADDPGMLIQLAQMLRGFGKVPPTGLLPKFVQRMRSEDDPNRRDTYFFAVVEYRQQAKPYLADLRKVQGSEPSPITQKNMAEAIQAVEATQ